MNRKDIIKLAHEAGLKRGQHWDKTKMDTEHMERFAELVAEAERETCEKTCAYLVDISKNNDEYNYGCVDCAKAIRLRGEK